MNWVIKDGIGQAGGIAFAAWLGRRKGLDADPKRWRIVSALAMDGATFLEILSPLFPGYFLFVASVANVGKNIAYLSASASRAAIHNSYAMKRNLADLTAKAGSQTIFASLGGTALGVALSKIVGSEWLHVASAFAALSVVHLSCVHLAVRSVILRSFNRDRLHQVIRHYLDTAQPNATGNLTGQLLTPKEVSQTETIFPVHTQKDPFDWIVTAQHSLDDIFPNGKTDYDKWVSGQRYGGHDQFILRYDQVKRRCVLGIVHGASSEDILQAFLQAQVLKDDMDNATEQSWSDEELEVLEKKSQRRAEVLFPTFVEKVLDVGWDCHQLFVEPETTIRYSFEHQI